MILIETLNVPISLESEEFDKDLLKVPKTQKDLFKNNKKKKVEMDFKEQKLEKLN